MNLSGNWAQDPVGVWNMCSFLLFHVLTFFFLSKESFKMCCHQCGHSVEEKNDSLTWDLLISDSLTLFPDLCGTPINDPEP